MQIIAKRTLKLFWLRHPQAEVPLRNWYAIVDKADWRRPEEVKAAFGATVDFVEDSRVVFDIAGNKYRLVTQVAYRYKRVLVKFVGTHKEYDKISAGSVK